jgi:hypothetical protein
MRLPLSIRLSSDWASIILLASGRYGFSFARDGSRPRRVWLLHQSAVTLFPSAERPPRPTAKLVRGVRAQLEVTLKSGGHLRRMTVTQIPHRN